ncbi:MAG: hypothetical protein QW806_02350 [Nitrososphaerota archaeon]
MERAGLQKIILGNLPLIGISYQGEEKDEEYKKRFSNKDEIKKVMKVALKYGIRYFAASSHDFNELSPIYLNAIKELEEDEGIEIFLIPCMRIPLKIGKEEINDHRRWATHLNYEVEKFGKEVMERYFGDPILNCRYKWKENLKIAKPYNLKEVEKELKIDWKKWENDIFNLSNYRIAWIEPGSESDFITISRIDLLEELIDRTLEIGYRVLLGSHHFGVSSLIIEEEKIGKIDGYVTPINKLGVMMFPNKEEVENNIIKIRENGKIVIAIKPFAGGRIEPKEALDYVYKRMKADSCMIGVGSVKEAEEDFKIAKIF